MRAARSALAQGRLVERGGQRPGSGALVWTMSELSLFLEGSELVGRIAPKPPPWSRAEPAFTFR